MTASLGSLLQMNLIKTQDAMYTCEGLFLIINSFEVGIFSLNSDLLSWEESTLIQIVSSGYTSDGRLYKGHRKRKI